MSAEGPGHLAVHVVRYARRDPAGFRRCASRRWRSRSMRSSASSAGARRGGRRGSLSGHHAVRISMRGRYLLLDSKKVSEEPMDDCVFCKIVAGKIPAKKVAENEGAIAFPTSIPACRARAGWIPKKHVASLNEVGDGSVMARCCFSPSSGAPERPRQERLATVIKHRSDAHQSCPTSTSTSWRARWVAPDERQRRRPRPVMCFPENEVCTSWVPS